MLTIEDFTKPTSHPLGMLEQMHLQHTSETEGFMAWFLGQCIDANDLDAEIKTRNCEDHMTVLDLLEKVGKKTYKLTRKAKGLLYVHYAK